MTSTHATKRNPARRSMLLIALLAATAMLAGGAQALAPAPAAAAINEGEECEDPTLGSIDCESESGGGGGGSEGSGTGDGAGADGDTVGTETIVIHDPVSPCLRQPSSCRSSEIGGRPQARRDDGRSARAPRPRGVLGRGRKVPIWTHVTPEDCRRLRLGVLVLPSEIKEAAQRAQLGALGKKLKGQLSAQALRKEEEAILLEELKVLRRKPSDNGVEIGRDEMRLGEIWNSLEDLKSQTAPFFALQEEILNSPARAERQALVKACKDLEGN